MIKQSKSIPDNSIDNLFVEIRKIEYQPIHYHPEMEVILVLEGSPTITINGDQNTYKTRDIIVISPHDTHSIYSQNESSELLILYIDPIFFSGYFPNMKNIRFTANKLKSANDDMFTYTFMTLARAYINKEKYYQINCASYVNILIFDILNGCSYYEQSVNQPFIISSENKRLSLIIEYIQVNYFKKIKLEHLAETLELSPTYLSHFIKQNLKRSFSDFLNYVRYVNAKRMIHEMNYSLVDISVIVGFSDYRYMTKAFKTHLDMTPKEYREHLILKPKANFSEDINSLESHKEMLNTMDEFMEEHQFKKYY